jgi:hypothetical protein
MYERLEFTFSVSFAKPETQYTVSRIVFTFLMALALAQDKIIKLLAAPAPQQFKSCKHAFKID